MFRKIYSFGILGIQGYQVQVEVDVSDGLPCFTMVGYLSSEVREAADRVKTALRNSGFKLPPKKITVNLSPADTKKSGTFFDLPIAIGILSAYGVVKEDCLKDSIIVGELGLNGEVKPINGALSMALAAKEMRMKRCFFPLDNVVEGVMIQGIEAVGIGHLKELIGYLNDPGKIKCYKNSLIKPVYRREKLDYSEVKGQMFLKRATQVAVAGRHNLLYIGPAGSGKTMMAKRIPTIMPPMDFDEKIEVSKIYSVCGCLKEGQGLVEERPFRNPHHTISPQALIGGGSVPRPGEITLATGGVLFLDELAEFKQSTLELLRQPLEEQSITITRVHGRFSFPAKFMLVAAMNPCQCGYYPDRQKCRCNREQIQRYLGKLSKPLLDRIDICVEASMVPYQALKSQEGCETSKEIQSRIRQVYQVQAKRFAGTDILFNNDMGVREIERYCKLSNTEERFFKKIFDSMGLSARAYNKTLKVARTIADLDGKEEIEKVHLSEAISYRGLEEKYWGIDG